MITHIWTVLCSRAVIDRDSNNCSLQNVIEQLNIKKKPEPEAMLVIAFDVVTLWSRTNPGVPGRGRERLTFLSPSGTELGSFEISIDLSNTKRFRSQVRFEGLPVREPGLYSFRVDLQNDSETEWYQVAAIPLEITFELPEPTSPSF
ncbi:MAG: hypothetical protein KKD28_11085 [Chloroflexi bacterium]|nr:hypothetical protein [Chloroflexota bacterium]MBU1662000.1 hypothetical protein [Chloroflexota bacterium]